MDDPTRITRKIMSECRNRQEERDMLPFVCHHVPVPELSQLIVCYGATFLQTDVEYSLYCDWDCLWGYKLMPAVMGCLVKYNQDFAFLEKELQFSQVDIYGLAGEPEERKFWCSRPRCLYFKACYCGNQLSLRDWVIDIRSKQHRFSAELESELLDKPI